MNWLADLVRLLARVPRARGIFLRREYEWFAGPLRRLARLYRRTLIADTRLAVVVGSLGKTTTARALHAALACPPRGFCYSNYGAALAGNLLRVRPGDRHAVLEAGIGGPGWMGVYSWFLQPDIVVVTAIASEHYRSFPSLGHCRDEKAEIVRRLPPDGVAFLNGDDPNVRWMATQTRARVVTFGLGEDNDVRAEDVRPVDGGLRFDARLRTGRLPVEIRFNGRHMVYPFLVALAVAEHEGGDPAAAAARLAGLAPADARMETLHLANGVRILDDSFKGGLETVQSALDALAGLPAGRRIVLFGGVEDPPGKWRDIHREVGRRMATVADRIYCLASQKNTSPLRAGAVAAGMRDEDIVALGSDIAAAHPALAGELRPGDVLLLKGRSTQRLRRVALQLLGRRVGCAVAYCGVKVTTCDACPLLDAPAAWFHNRFIARYVRE